jgi:hypothetical protein
VQQRAPDRATLTEQLLYVEGRISLCRTHIDRQQGIIADLLAKGADPAPARRLLGEVTNLLAMNLIERDRLKRDLDQLVE